MLASSDFYSPNSVTSVKDDFDWEKQGSNLFDEKSRKWLCEGSHIVIKEYKINRWEDLLIVFSNNDRLEIFVDSSDDTECWRLLKCCNDEEHLVVTGLRLDFE